MLGIEVGEACQAAMCLQPQWMRTHVCLDCHERLSLAICSEGTSAKQCMQAASSTHLHSQHAPGIVRHKLRDFLLLLCAAQIVNLVHDENHLLAPFADVSQELDLALGEGPVCRQQPWPSASAVHAGMTVIPCMSSTMQMGDLSLVQSTYRVH